MALTSWAIEEVRTGTIRLWHGLLANIPTGYVLCDGTNGTPDLRSKFVKGAAIGQNPGSIGGAATHTHAQHVSDGAHTHDSHGFTEPSDHVAQSHIGGAVGSIAASGTAAVKIGTSASSAASSGHTHPAPGFTQPSQHPALSHINAAVTPATHTSQGGHQHDIHDVPNSEPEYYTVAYIMKS